MTRPPLTLLLLTGLVTLPLLLHAQPQRCADGLQPTGDPRNAEVVCLPELGRMYGTITCPNPDAATEHFGQRITPIGDIDGDSLADFIIGRTRCDTLFQVQNFHWYPEELLLYYGRRGALPASESGIRIGTKEVGSSCRVLAVGDWDGDGHIDIATRIYLYGDTTYGAQPIDEVTRLAIFWGSASGTFAITDTTHLSCDAQGWTGPHGAISMDADGDGAADLVVSA